MTPERVEIVKRLLTERVTYDPETGLFFDKKTGKIKGLKNPHPSTRNGPRLEFKAAGSRIRVPAHKAAWFLHHGMWAPLLDHRDGDPFNNKIKNLREVTKFQNGWNRKAAGTSSKHKNVCFDPQRQGRKKYKVRVQANGTRRIIGWFATEQEAAEAAKEAMERLHGEYALHNRR